MKNSFYSQYLFIICAVLGSFLYSTLYSNSSSVSETYQESQFSNAETQQKLVSFYHVFQSSIFDSYLIQLKEFLFNQSSYNALVQLLDGYPRNTYLNKVDELINIIHVIPNTSSEKREWHEKFLQTLRKLIEIRECYSSTQNPVIVLSHKWVGEISFWMYTKPHLLDEYQNFLESKDLITISEFGDDLGQTIEKLFNKITQSSYFCGNIHPRVDVVDSHLDGYLPYHLFHAFSVSFVITPRVTIDFKETNVEEICPEFISYLNYLKSTQQTHLYINAMKRVSSGDQKYTEVIEKLNVEREFEDVLWITTLDKKSDFYWQENNYSNISHSEHFKKTFLHELFGKPPQESLFKWPRQMELLAWKSHCKELIDSVHRLFFKSKNSLSLQERLDFIEIIYIKIIQSLCEILRPDYANISCKESMDRAPSIFSLLYVFERLQSTGGLSLEEKMNAVTILLAPPLVSHNRTSHEPRIQRTISSMNHVIKVLQKK